MAAAFSARVNDQQALGLDLSNPPGKGPPIFAVGAPRSLPATTNLRNPDGSFAVNVGLTINNPKQLQASSYKLQADPAAPGSYQITRLSDGLVRSVAEGDSVDGFKFSLGGATPGPSDSFLLEPVSQAATNMKRSLDQATGIAAASPLTARSEVGNKGTMTVDSMYAVNSNVDPGKAPIKIAFGDADPADASKLLYTLTLADGTIYSGSWKAGQPIGNSPNASPPIDLGFELKLNGLPRKDDQITVEATKFTSANNGNAKAFLNIQTETFVGQRLQADGSLAQGATINDAYASAMSDIGSRVQGATYLSSVSTSVAANAEAERSGQSGVNLDEEASRLMQYQQGYQAAAKVLQAAQSIFDELLKLAAR